MCHPDAPTGATAAGPAGDETTIVVDDGQAMPAFLARSAASEPAGVVIVVGDIYGARTPFYEHIARLLAAHGFDAVVPEYFFRVGPLPEPTQEAAFARKAQLDEAQVLVDLDRAVTWARARTGNGGRVGTLGFCLGGTFVLDLAARNDDLATVCYYGFPAGAPGPPGAPERSAPKPLDEVDRIHGPLLGHWGDQDERVGIPNVEAFARALEQRGVDFEHTVYPGLDHGFLQVGFDEGAPGHDLAAASWARTLAFLETHVAG